MRKYLSLTRNSLLLAVFYRMNLFFSTIGNGIYIVLTYFLWKAIFSNSDTSIHGMTFHDTFAYLAGASVIFSLFKNYLEWEMSHEIISGDIIMRLLKPVDFQLMALFRTFGFVIINLLFVTIPSLVILVLIFPGSFSPGIAFPFFILAVVFAFFISFLIDFMIGTFAFYTESIWGISVAKESVVLFLSGALVPLSFFPPIMQKIMLVLPFRAIYNIPLIILTGQNPVIHEYLNLLGIQIFWVGVLFFVSRLFFNKAIKNITVNGG